MYRNGRYDIEQNGLFFQVHTTMNLTLLPAIVNSCGPSTLNLDIGTNHLVSLGVKHNGRKCLQN